MRLNFWNRKAPEWNQLDEAKKRYFTAKTMKAIKALSGARYKVVSGTDEWQREKGQIERFGEDYYLDANRRGRMLDLARNQARNSSTFNGILKQFDINVVGTKGGKCILNFNDNDYANVVKDEFAKWTRNADFFDGLNFNTMLKLILKTYIIGGDMVLLYDDGIVTDSGKLLIYEPDEIGNTTDEALAQRFGKYARQSLGRVYDENSRFIGCIVSRSQRGEATFAPDKSYFLRRDPDESMFDNFWMMPRNVFREAQGRGISPCASSLATIIDLEDLCGFELAAAKKNSQTIAQITQESSSSEQAEIPSAFDNDTDFSGMSAQQIEEAIKAEQSTQEQTVTLDKVNAAGVIYQVLPENYKMELLDTKHPNSTMPEFIRFLAGRSAAPFGLTEQYATLCANGSDFKSQQLLAKPVFEECQKFLENICDFIIYRWAIWATKHGTIDITKLGDNWQKKVSWSWNRQSELDEQAYQNATAMKLKNMTGSYAEYWGNDWKEKLMQIRDEINWCKENGLPHPSFEMKSGGERTGADQILQKDI